MRFELTVKQSLTTVFKTAALNHSAILPGQFDAAAVRQLWFRRDYITLGRTGVHFRPDSVRCFGAMAEWQTPET